MASTERPARSRPTIRSPLKGLFYGGGTQVLVAQAIGSLVITTTTFVIAYAVMQLVNATGTLRVSREGELYGLDLHEHGISAYPEYVISSAGTPVGMADESANWSPKAMRIESVILREERNC